MRSLLRTLAPTTSSPELPASASERCRGCSRHLHSHSSPPAASALEISWRNRASIFGKYSSACGVLSFQHRSPGVMQLQNGRPYKRGERSKLRDHRPISMSSPITPFFVIKLTLEVLQKRKERRGGIQAQPFNSLVGVPGSMCPPMQWIGWPLHSRHHINIRHCTL